MRLDLDYPTFDALCEKLTLWRSKEIEEQDDQQQSGWAQLQWWSKSAVGSGGRQIIVEKNLSLWSQRVKTSLRAHNNNNNNKNTKLFAWDLSELFTPLEINSREEKKISSMTVMVVQFESIP